MGKQRIDKIIISNQNLIFRDKKWYIETLSVDVRTGDVIESKEKPISEKEAHKIIDNYIDENNSLSQE